MSGETDELCEMDVVELEKQESLFCFESMQDYNKLCFLMLSCTCIAVVLVWNSALTMCSGNYIFAKSQLDVLILSADILSIDLFSCAFVVCGYTASFVFVAVGLRQWQELRSKLCWGCYSIGLSSSAAAVVVCSLWRGYLGHFHGHDIFLTLAEGFTSVRLLDVNQDPARMHSLNVFVWPVLIMFWSLLTLEWTWAGNHKIVKLVGSAGHYMLVLLAMCGISLFTLFGMLHSKTNIFYANATSIAYRTLEFNLGVHTHFLQEAQFRPLADVMQVLRQCRFLILFVFCATWWSEIGVVVQEQTEVCLRLYAGNSCLRDHHAFLLRGCILGLTLLSSVDEKQGSVVSLKSMLHILPVVPSALAFCCPVYSFLLLVFVVTFSKTLVYSNIACVALVLSVLLWLLSYLFCLQILPWLQECVQASVEVVIMKVREALVPSHARQPTGFSISDSESEAAADGINC